MIERLLAADAALDREDLDLAEKLFGQVAEADERNAIAVVGLGRVAMRRGDADEARMRMAHALALDPEEAAAQRLLAELEGGVSRAGVPAAQEQHVAEPDALEPDTEKPATPTPQPEPERAPAPARERESLLTRIRRWLGFGRSRR
jgi:tetratricopeptide (TPR) repeat protein